MRFQNYGLLGQQLINTLAFWEKSFLPSLGFICPVTQEKLTSGDLFEAKGEKWVMRGESLPGYVAIKAIGIDRNALFVETAEIDEELVGTVISSNELPVRYDARKRKFFHARTQKVLISLSKVDRTHERCLWTISVSGLTEIERDIAIAVIDSIVIDEAFVKLDEEPETTRSVPTMQLLQELDLSMVQLLEQEQQPRLMLNLQGEMNIQGEMSQIQTLLILQARINRMTPDELLEFATRDVTPQGQKSTLRIMHFVLSGRVKKTHQDISWKEARKISWTLINKSVAKTLSRV